MKVEWKSLLRIGVGIFLLYLGIHYWPSLSGLLGTIFSAAIPLIIGCAIAYFINILMSWFEKHYFPHSDKKIVKNSRRIVCMIAAIITMIAIIALVIALILPQLTDCVMLLINEIPSAIDKTITYIDELGVLPENIMDSLDKIDWKSRIGQIINVLTTGVGSVVDVAFKTVTSIFSGTVTALVAIIFSVYILVGKEKIGSQLKRLMGRYIKPTVSVKISHVLSVINDCFHKFIVGQCTEAVILGVLCTIGMLIFRFPYATMIGALIAFTALIPIAGAYIGAGVGAFMILTVSPIKALLFLVYIVILQQLEGNIIYPKVVGSSIGLPGIWVLAAVTIGGGVMGVVGMLLGVPLAAAAYRLLREDVKKAPAASTVSAADPAGV
ncbi:MAG: AI-2E family transporter [Ruminococcaceae bacterium]|nr:AI-2E family transporter [Oscillospiraceae bacterium]